MSIELCSVTGDEAASLINQRLGDPTIPLRLGGRALGRILGADHDGHGRTVITFEDGPDNTGYVQFVPTEASFAATATDIHGQPICAGCVNC